MTSKRQHYKSSKIFLFLQYIYPKKDFSQKIAPSWYIMQNFYYICTNE